MLAPVPALSLITSHFMAALAMSKLSKRTQDLDEAMSMVRSVYCPHSLALGSGQRSISTQLSVTQGHQTPIVQLAYGADVVVDAGNFDDIFLIMQCLSGWGKVRQGNDCGQWSVGDILPVSTNRSTRFDFTAQFEQISIRPDKQRLQNLCASWLGHPLERDLRFELRPFTAELRQSWGAASNLLMRSEAQLPQAAQQSLEEALFTLLLTGHEHNYSERLRQPCAVPASRLVRRFEQYVKDDVQPDLGVSAVARQLNVSVRSLQYAVQKELNTTPQLYLRDARLDRVHQTLSREEGASIADVAYAHGFAHLGRFAAFYKARFGEKPSDTAYRTRSAATDGGDPSALNG